MRQGRSDLRVGFGGARCGVRGAALLTLAAGAALGLPCQALAAPQGASVQQGTVNIATSGSQTTITASDGAIINYTSFDIASGGLVRVVQPGASARVLNRITSAQPTTINGALLANGQVYIVNPAGVVFGNNSVVSAAQLFAVAGDIANADFVAGVNRFSNIQGGVVAQGFISAEAVHLVGQTVSNAGTIISQDGLVTMLVGDEVLLREQGGRISVRIDGEAIEPGSAPNATVTPASTVGVENTGIVDAREGRIVLGAGDAVSLAVRNAGRLSASGGEIHLSSANGSVANEAGAVIEVHPTANEISPNPYEPLPSALEARADLEGQSVRNLGSINASGGGAIGLRATDGVVIGPDATTLALGTTGTISIGTVAGDVEVTSDLRAGSLVEIDAGSDVLFGTEFQPPDLSTITPEVIVDAETVRIDAADTFQDRVFDIVTGEEGTRIGSLTTRLVDLTARGGRVDFGVATVGDGGTVRLTQANALALGDERLGNGPGTNLVARVTEGTLTFDSIAGGTVDETIRVLSLDGSTAKRDIVVRADIDAERFVRLDAGLDIALGAPLGQTELVIDARTIDAVASRTFDDRVINGAALGSLRTDQINLTARDGTTDFGPATVRDGGFVRLDQTATLARSSDAFGNGPGTNLRVRVRDGLARFDGDQTLALRSFVTLADRGAIGIDAPVEVAGITSLTALSDNITVREAMTGGGNTTFTAGDSITLLAGVASEASLAMDAGGSIEFGAVGGGTPVFTVSGRSVDATATGDIIDHLGGVGVTLGTGNTSSIDLVSIEGGVGFGRATVENGGRVGITQATSRTQAADAFTNGAATDVVIAITAGDLVFAGSGDELALRSLDASASGSITNDSAIRAADSLTLNAETLTARGDLIAGAPLTIASDDVFIGGDVRFAADRIAVFGTMNAEAATEAAALTLDGNTSLDASIGDTLALDSFTVNGTTHFAGGSVTTTGDQSYNGELTLDRDASFIATESGAITFSDDVVAVVGAPDLTAVASPDALVRFGGDLGAADARLGSVIVRTSGEAGADRSTVPAVATIGFDRGGELFVDSFAVGQREKMTAIGDLLIDATSAVTLGDVNTLGDLRVSAGSLTLLRRAPGSVLLGDGSVIVDGGVDLVAGGLIDINAPVMLGGPAEGAAPLLGAEGGVFMNGSAVAATELATGFVSESSLISDGGTLLDIAILPAGGPGDATLIDQRAQNTLEREFTDRVVLAAQLEALERIGIPMRLLSQSEIGDAADGVFVASNLPDDADGYGRFGPILAARFDPVRVRSLINRFESVFGPASEDRTPHVVTLMDSILAGYIDDTGAATIDPDDFIAWVGDHAASGEATETLMTLAGILRGIQTLGLTDAEYRLARVEFARRIVGTSLDVTPERMALIIEDARRLADTGEEDATVAAR